MLPILHFTMFQDYQEQSDFLNDFIDDIDSGPIICRTHRFVSLDGEFEDFALTPMEEVLLLSELYGIENALKEC